MEKFSWKERALLTAILGGVFVLVAFDVWTDWNTGASFSHLATEAFVALLALLGIAFIWSRNILLSHKVERLDRDLESAKADASKWKAENAHLLQGLGEAIEKQLAQWGLTGAEREIATLLLKGLSLKEIAEARATSERTVRQQTIALYSKSGLAGRAELAAYFLEDLFAPINRGQLLKSQSFWCGAGAWGGWREPLSDAHRRLKKIKRHRDDKVVRIELR